MSIADNIKCLREQFNLTQGDLGEIAGVSGGAVSTWERGIADPRMGAVQKMADYFKVSKSDIIGDDETFVRPNRVPVLGSVPAGIPIEAIEDIVDWEDVPMSWTNSGQEFFGLKVVGNSMYPKYMEGDTVIVRKQEDCECGQDCVVYVNGYDATLKKVIKVESGIMLQPLNPEYTPKIYPYDSEVSIKIAGVVVELRRTI